MESSTPNTDWAPLGLFGDAYHGVVANNFYNIPHLTFGSLLDNLTFATTDSSLTAAEKNEVNEKNIAKIMRLFYPYFAKKKKKSIMLMMFLTFHTIGRRLVELRLRARFIIGANINNIRSWDDYDTTKNLWEMELLLKKQMK